MRAGRVDDERVISAASSRWRLPLTRACHIGNDSLALPPCGALPNQTESLLPAPGVCLIPLPSTTTLYDTLGTLVRNDTHSLALLQTCLSHAFPHLRNLRLRLSTERIGVRSPCLYLLLHRVVRSSPAYAAFRSLTNSSCQQNCPISSTDTDRAFAAIHNGDIHARLCCTLSLCARPYARTSRAA